MIIYLKDPNWNPYTIEPKKIVKSSLPWFLNIEDHNKKIVMINFKYIYFMEFDIKSAEMLVELSEYYE